MTMLLTHIQCNRPYSVASGNVRKQEEKFVINSTSTINCAVSKELVKEVEYMGAMFTNARVSGHIRTIGSGSLAFAPGEMLEQFGAPLVLLGCIDSTVGYRGASRTGQAAKICNMLWAISTTRTAKAMNLTIRLGLDPKLLAKILNMISGQYGANDTNNPVSWVMD